MNRIKKLRTISNAIADVVSEVGHDKLTIPVIASKAGMTPSNLYVYFNSKTDMLNYADYDIENQLITAMLQPCHDKYDAIFTICHNLFYHLLSHPQHFSYLKQRNHISAYHLLHGEFTDAKIELNNHVSAAALRVGLTSDGLSCLLFSPIIDLATIALTKSPHNYDDVISLIVSRTYPPASKQTHTLSHHYLR
ncbi:MULTISPECIES: TetR/AcrR family transcriptional regulator [Vibrio]|uniref:TetR/AcrR family transcriptional regulator n=1 Tax=Vibrio TaxID=662 RepID=UPI003D0CDDD8